MSTTREAAITAAAEVYLEAKIRIETDKAVEAASVRELEAVAS